MPAQQEFKLTVEGDEIVSSLFMIAKCIGKPVFTVTIVQFVKP
jgi:hypothetical protein